MPNREEQFDAWFQDSSTDDLLDAVLKKRRESIEEDFLSSREFRDAQEQFVVEELMNSGTLDDFDENKWYDESADVEDEEDDTETDLGESSGAP